MKWEDIELFCYDCIVKNICQNPCEDIKEFAKKER